MPRLLIHPFFLLCCGLFVANQVAERTGRGLPLLSAYLDDLLCLPMVLTLTLLLMQRLVLRDFTYRLPDPYLALAVGMFAVFFECLLPLLSPRYVRDPWDVLAYAVGALLFRLWINRPPSPAHGPPDPPPSFHLAGPRKRNRKKSLGNSPPPENKTFVPLPPATILTPLHETHP
jgi:hypothetical protein